MPRPTHVAAVLVLVACAPDAIPSAPPTATAEAPSIVLPPPVGAWQVVDLGTPVGYSEGDAKAINDAGVIVGTVREGPSSRPSRWMNGAVELLALPAGTTSGTAYDINGAGTIVGRGFSPVAPNDRALRWTASGVTELPHLGFGAYALAINTAGTAVGWVYHADSSTSAARWSSTGTLTVLPTPTGWTEAKAVAINDAGDIVGVASTASVEVSWAWPASGGAGQGLGWGSGAADIASDGRVVLNGSIQAVTYGATAMPPYATVTTLWQGWTAGVSDGGRFVGVDKTPYPERAVTRLGTSTKTLPVLSGTWESWARGVNRCGVVVGRASVVFKGRPMKWSRLICDP